jgi:hypothetical protein
MVCEHAGGMLEFSDFLPRPSAHPLCYLTCYMIKSGGTFLPFARFAAPEKISEFMADSYLIRLEGEEAFFRDVINDLYARGERDHLKLFRRLIDTLYPPHTFMDVFERQRLAESSVRTVYIHAHMDEDTFDCSRAMLCPDLVPAAPEKLIPACTYNLLKDDRFYVVPG